MKSIVKSVYINILSDMFPIKYDIIEEIATIFHLCFRICYYESPGKQGGLKLNGTYQHLV
jgi:hypothetical protein